MSAQNSIEVTGNTVEEAIAKGLEQLGVGPSQVIVEVLEEPSRGILGFGARAARVRLQMLAPPPPPRQTAPPVTPAAPKEAASPAPAKPVYHGDDDDFFDEDGSYGGDDAPKKSRGARGRGGKKGAPPLAERSPSAAPESPVASTTDDASPRTRGRRNRVERGTRLDDKQIRGGRGGQRNAPPKRKPEEGGESLGMAWEPQSRGERSEIERQTQTRNIEQQDPQREPSARSTETGSNEGNTRGRGSRGGRGRRRGERGERSERGSGTSVPSEVVTPPVEFENEASEVEIATQVLVELLDIMDIPASVKIAESAVDEDDKHDEPRHILNISGESDELDLEMLVGRRGETLAALQYLLRLIVSKQTESRAVLVVDVNDYRLKRAEKIEKLAMRMADQAVETGRTVKMEPMPPHERRIVHMVLRRRDDVTTESTGQGEERRVTIIPSRNAVKPVR